MSKQAEDDAAVAEVKATPGETEARPNQAAEAADLDLLKEARFTRVIDNLVEFLSQRRRAFLVGAGCSKCEGLPLMDELTKAVLDRLPKNNKSRCILTAVVKNFAGASHSNIEDYMSELVDLISVLDRRHLRSATNVAMSMDGDDYGRQDLVTALQDIKDAVADLLTPKKVSMAAHRRFVKAVHGKLQAGKSGAPPCVDYFLLNYELLFEDALALERVPFVDGFDGGATGWWNPRTYSASGVSARVFKIHGSIDWCIWKGEQLPRRVRDGFGGEEIAERVVIWPASTKYRETQRDPYAQMIGMMRKALRPEPLSQTVLAICGYGFGDSHINIEVEQALRESEQRLTVMVFTNCNQPEGILADWHSDASIRDQVQIYANRGFYHGNSILRSDHDLPWWHFEVLGRLLGGER